MKKLNFPSLLPFFTTLVLLVSVNTNSESIRHFEGEAANSYAEAIMLLKTHNAELAQILNKEDGELADLGKIHKLTYTLENAIEKIQDEISVASKQLEKLHKASEKADLDKAKALGKSYLETSNQITSQP